MTHFDDVEDLKDKRICHQCVGETYLSNDIALHGTVAKCSYCGQSAETYELETIAECVETAFEHHYYLTAEEPEYWQQRLIADRESSYTWFPSREVILQTA